MSTPVLTDRLCPDTRSRLDRDGLLIGTDGERDSKKYILLARLDDEDDVR